MKDIKTSLQLFLCISILALSEVGNAAVKYKTVELDVAKDGVVIGKRVVVTCRFDEENREIFKQNGSRKWCDTTFTEICATKKNDLAETVCTRGYRRKVASQQDVKESDEVVKLKEELMEIERKRLNIADKVRELKRREQKLQNKT